MLLYMSLDKSKNNKQIVDKQMIILSLLLPSYLQIKYLFSQITN